MIYTYRNFDELLTSPFSLVLIGGNVNIFANDIINAQKQFCRGGMFSADVPDDILSEFGILTDSDANSTEVGMDFAQFCSVAYSPCITGRWFCVSDIDSADADKLSDYIQNPSEYGTLIIRIPEYRKFSRYQNMKAVKLHKRIAFINLTFPTARFLSDYVQHMFTEAGQVISSDACELFISRLGTHYDDYRTMADRFYKYTDKRITYKDVAETLHDVENYAIDDLMTELTIVNTSEKKTNRKIYRIIRSLLSEMDINSLISAIHYKSLDLCDMRLFINKGYIPVGYNYSVADAQSRMPEGHKLKSMHKYPFGRLVDTAGRTTLFDWLYIAQLTTVRSFTALGGMRVLHILIHRDLYNANQLIRILDNQSG